MALQIVNINKKVICVVPRIFNSKLSTRLFKGRSLMMETAGNAEPEMNPGEELFTSVEECPEPVEASVSGDLPTWLKGCLLRVGPAKFEWGETSYNHWFDGDGLLHKFEVYNGTVKYSSHFVRSQSYLHSKEKGRIDSSQYATVKPPDPCKNIFSRFFSKFLPSSTPFDNTNVNLVTIKERIFASTETSSLNRINPETLETVERVDLSQELKGRRGWLAHPHVGHDGAVYNLSIVWDKGVYEIIKVPPRKNELEEAFAGAAVQSTISFNWKPSYYHSFGMTEHYYILFNNPYSMTHSALLMLMDVMNWSFKDMFVWDNHGSTSILVIDRTTGKVAKRVSTEKMFAFHHVNAYEDDDGDVVIDILGYKDASVIDAFYLHNMRKPEKVSVSSAAFRRYKIHMKDVGPGETEPRDSSPENIDYEQICDNAELPAINYSKFNCKKYSFAYCIYMEGFDWKTQSLVKVNVTTKEILRWKEDDCYASEPVFVESPNAEEEDDGLVLSAVVGLKGRSSFLLVLDAKTFQEIARAEVPMRIATSLHGFFLKDK